MPGYQLELCRSAKIVIRSDTAVLWAWAKTLLLPDYLASAIDSRRVSPGMLRCTPYQLLPGKNVLPAKLAQIRLQICDIGNRTRYGELHCAGDHDVPLQ